MAINTANIKFYESANSQSGIDSLGGAITTTELTTGLNGLFDLITAAESASNDVEYPIFHAGSMQDDVTTENPINQDNVIDGAYRFVLNTTFSKKDLEDAQYDAILKYDAIRKQRKKEKQERLKEESVQNELKATLRRAVAPPQKEFNPFGGCY